MALEKGEVDGTLEEWGRGGSSYDVLPERKIEKKKKNQELIEHHLKAVYLDRTRFRGKRQEIICPYFFLTF